MKRIGSILLVFALLVTMIAIPVSAAQKPKIKQINVYDIESETLEDSYVFSYDKNGRVSKVISEGQDSFGDSYTTAITYAYDSKGNVKSITNGNEETGEKSYKITFKNTYNGNQVKSSKIVFFTYDEDGTESEINKWNIKYTYKNKKLSKYVKEHFDGTETVTITSSGTTMSASDMPSYAKEYDDFEPITWDILQEYTPVCFSYDGWMTMFIDGVETPVKGGPMPQIEFFGYGLAILNGECIFYENEDTGTLDYVTDGEIIVEILYQ